jgi:hypothetical protein
MTRRPSKEVFIALLADAAGVVLPERRRPRDELNDDPNVRDCKEIRGDTVLLMGWVKGAEGSGRQWTAVERRRRV